MKNYIKLINDLIFYTGLIFLLMILSFFILLNKGLFLKSSINDYLSLKSEPFDGTTYPIEYVPNPMILSFEQRKQNFEKIDSKYFIKIPKYDPNIFGRKLEDLKPGTKEYEETIVQRLIYTIPYLSTYKFDYKEYSGSHPGVDIIAPKGTPIKSIANGVVVEAKTQTSNFGNYVYIRHKDVPLTDGLGTIYSLYGHMNKIFVKPGTIVKKGDIIGEVGDTGLSTADHLHFQIDLESAPFKAYWPFSSNDMKKSGFNFFEAVNIGLGKENAKKYTINPFKFVNSNIEYVSTNIEENNSLETQNINEEKIEITQENNNSELTFIEDKPKIEVDNFLDKIISNDEPKEDLISSIKTSNNEENQKNNDLLLSNEKDFMLLSNIEIALSGSNLNLLKSGIKIDNFEKVENMSINLPLDKTETENIIEIQTNQEKLKSENLEKSIEPILLKTNNNIEKEKNILFNDISNDYKYIEELKYFIEKKYISGFKDDTFKPENNITRAEALKIILLSNNIKIQNDNTKYFLDVDENSWINNYIGYALKSGLIKDNSNNFNPNNYITRVEFVKWYSLLNNVELEQYNKSKTDISDILDENWEYKYMVYAFKKNLFELDFGKIYPNKTLTREELIKILY